MCHMSGVRCQVSGVRCHLPVAGQYGAVVRVAGVPLVRLAVDEDDDGLLGGVAGAAVGLRGVDVQVQAVLVLVPLQEVEQLLKVVHPAHRHKPAYIFLNQF